MWNPRVTRRASTIIAAIVGAGVLFIAFWGSKALVGVLIVAPLIVLVIGIPWVLAIRCQRLKDFFKPPVRHDR